MPQIKLHHVVWCSSEEKNFPAKNLISCSGFKKWKSAATGEKQISVMIEFEEESKISQIDIGNEGSAFVEVLVGKSSMKEEDYKVILLKSSFMSPLDSRADKNTNSVKMFTEDKLAKIAREEKWNRIQIVCTQPFNKSVHYGLSFIKFHGPPEDGNTDTPPKQTILGAFKLKPSDSDIKTGSLFASRNEKKMDPAPVAAVTAPISASSRLVADSPKPAKQESTTSKQPVKRKHSDNAEPTTSAKVRKSSEDQESIKTPLRKQSTSISSIVSNRSDSKRPKERDVSLKRSHTVAEKPAKKEAAFNKIMKKVVFVMSGFQNPLRGRLRDKALEMGADYSTDWGRHCTHLICAFENTPKYSQVQGKGRIVKQTWIEDCYKAERLLPWRKYRLGRAKTPPGGSDSSDDDGEDDSRNKKAKHTPRHKVPVDSKPQSRSKADVKAEDPYAGETDSGDDTEDEIERVKQTERQNTGPPPTDNTAVVKQKTRGNIDDDIYDASTDEETDEETDDGGGAVNGAAALSDNGDLPDLPDYFKGRNFFLFGKFNKDVQRRLKRYIIAYNGHLERYMTEKVSYVITESDWDDNFDQALAENGNLAFIRPDWIFSCDEKQKFVPFQKYIVVPQD